MRPCLNQDILFDIGKKLIEENDQEAVIRFGLSGKEPLKALCKVFSTVTTLELHDDGYSVGWDDKICKFYLTKPLVLFLMKCIGESVTKLRLDYNKESSMKYYQNLLNKIADMRQLTSLSVLSYYNFLTIFALIQKFPSTLEHLEIDPSFLSLFLQDCLNLKSLTVLNSIGGNFIQNCPKTSTVIFKNTDGSSAIESLKLGLLRLHNDFRGTGPHLDTVKELIMIDQNDAIKMHDVYTLLEICMQFFPYLEQITFKIHQTKKILGGFFSYFYSEVSHLIVGIGGSISVPSKITYIAEDQISPYSSYRVYCLKELMKDFEFDGDTVPGFFCFRQMVKSCGTNPVLFEVQIPKGNKK